jgi:hypothetical protein
MNQDEAVVVNDEGVATNTQLEVQKIVLKRRFPELSLLLILTKNGCISFFMSATGMSAPATPSKLAIRVLRETKQIKNSVIVEISPNDFSQSSFSNVNLLAFTVAKS